MEVDEGVKGLSGGGDLAVSKFVVPLQCKRVSPGGGIGRRARFRCECSKDVQVRFLSWALPDAKRLKFAELQIRGW